MKWEKFFYNEASEYTLKKARFSSLALLISTALLLLVFVIICIVENIDQIPLKISAWPYSEKAIQPQTGNDYSFQSFGGILSLKNTSLLERLLLHTTENKNILDYILLFAIGLSLYRTIRSVTVNKTFSEKISSTFKLISFMFVCMFMVGIFYERWVVDKIVLSKTGNNYRVVYSEGRMDYLIFGIIILTFVYFSNQGSHIQKEQDLTI